MIVAATKSCGVSVVLLEGLSWRIRPTAANADSSTPPRAVGTPGGRNETFFKLRCRGGDYTGRVPTAAEGGTVCS